jgi:hypothetical protein
VKKILFWFYASPFICKTVFVSRLICLNYLLEMLAKEVSFIPRDKTLFLKIYFYFFDNTINLIVKIELFQNLRECWMTKMSLKKFNWMFHCDVVSLKKLKSGVRGIVPIDSIIFFVQPLVFCVDDKFVVKCFGRKITIHLFGSAVVPQLKRFNLSTILNSI